MSHSALRVRAIVNVGGFALAERARAAVRHFSSSSSRSRSRCRIVVVVAGAAGRSIRMAWTRGTVRHRRRQPEPGLEIATRSTYYYVYIYDEATLSVVPLSVRAHTDPAIAQR